MAGLALQIQETVKLDPHTGHVFVFRGKRGDRASLCLLFLEARQQECLFSL